MSPLIAMTFSESQFGLFFLVQRRSLAFLALAPSVAFDGALSMVLSNRRKGRAVPAMPPIDVG